MGVFFIPLYVNYKSIEWNSITHKELQAVIFADA